MEENNIVNEKPSSVLSVFFSFFWIICKFQCYFLLLLVSVFLIERLMLDTKERKREKPSDEVLLKAHNKLCSSTDIEEAKNIIAEYPEVLPHKMSEWGGSNTLHTVCSRQPNNFHLIKLLVDEGLKQNVGGAPKVKGGLIARDYFDRTPLNVLVENNAIATLRKLMQCDPPLVVPYDVLDSRLFNSVHSTYHVDMFRFLVNLNPETLSNKHRFLKNRLLLDYMIERTSSVGFLLRILPIMIEEGIRQNVGGEYGGGGLFVRTGASRNYPADLLVRSKFLTWKIIGPVIGGVINNGTSSPILHGAIKTHMSCSILFRFDHVKGICEHVQNAASVQDSKGRMAIHVGAALGLQWDDESGGMSDVVKANMLAAKMKDPVTGLPLHALAAVGNYSLSSIYHLILVGGFDDFSS